MFIKFFGIILITLSLLSCKGSSGKPIIKSFDRTEQPYTITVHVFDTVKEVKAAKKKFDGKNTDGVVAWAKWSNKMSSGCEIYVQKIESMSQKDRMNSLAHEFLHCLYGKIHKEGYIG